MYQDWQFFSGECQISHDFSHRERIEFAGGGVRAYMEEIPIVAGVSLYRVDARGNGRFGMAKEDVPSEGRIILGCMRGGHGAYTMDGCATQTWRNDGKFYALTPNGRSVTYDVVAEQFWQVAALRIEAEALDMLAQDTGLPEVARMALEGRVDDLSGARAMTAGMRRLMQDLIDPPLGGGMRRLYMQAKALELLSQQCAAMGGFVNDDTLSARDMARLREARERLLADLGNPPGLEELAAAVGLTPRRLNKGFRVVFGTTVFDYLREARMDAARRMLEEGGDIPLKRLAWAVGYTQTSNFVTAFRRRFGVSPARYRRGRHE